ncbi:hypothetical protein BJP43_10615 (plasmid) [Candidatus Williamhamiltonella defendens]|uniref:Uncharacterized protein n=1 Tax=Candidatus Williamhamiltonella defendens TaxID=138072 RepID=A0A2D3TG89_9ENTR|nr:hypothetical protein BJP43_10615 [Candidatus Hamiltonella defensa]
MQKVAILKSKFNFLATGVILNLICFFMPKTDGSMLYNKAVSIQINHITYPMLYKCRSRI